VGHPATGRPHGGGQTGAAPHPLCHTLTVNQGGRGRRGSYLIIVRVRPHLPWKIFGDGLLVWATPEEAERAAAAYREALPHQEWKVVPQGET